MRVPVAAAMTTGQCESFEASLDAISAAAVAESALEPAQQRQPAESAPEAKKEDK